MRSGNSSQAALDITFQDRLKKATLSVHRCLESLPISKNLLQETPDPHAYKMYLLSMFEIVTDVEENFFPLLSGIISDLAQRKKKDWLLQDLQSLRVDINMADKKPLSSRSGKASVPFALGVAYVIEGSTLGGRYILKNLQSSVSTGTSFFTGYGLETGTLWKRFLQELNSFETTNNCAGEIIEGAVFGFNAIHDHLIFRSNHS